MRLFIYYQHNIFCLIIAHLAIDRILTTNMSDQITALEHILWQLAHSSLELIEQCNQLSHCPTHHAVYVLFQTSLILWAMKLTRYLYPITKTCRYLAWDAFDSISKDAFDSLLGMRLVHWNASDSLTTNNPFCISHEKHEKKKYINLAPCH